ncbi:MAG TPA: hypothetical protein DEQ38_11635 [Elusimicrobia bacterium]|nr:MAG: hypothetical protein A2089_11745 [Elusimicrobia bacterium GWD2_63_28]HCC48750.1 hypothetical protein [Elusimicrobiota bacterium]
MKKLFLTAAAAVVCAACAKAPWPVASAAENGLRQDLKAVGEVVNFRELKTEELAARDGKAVVLHFESEVKWLTLEESLARPGGPGDTQEYIGKAQYVRQKLGSAPKAGRSETIKGAVLLAKTDLGWIYNGLAGN